MSSKKLLFPTDFSPNSIRALRETIQLQAYFDFEIVIYHAYSRYYPEEKEDLDTTGHLKKIEKEVDQNFNRLLQQVPELTRRAYKFQKKLGSLVDQIAEDIHKYSLLVMSTKGAVGIGELFGTKTAKIIKISTIPVLVIPVDTQLAGLKKIGLACDFSKQTEYEKLQFLVEFVEKQKVEIDIVTLNRQEKTMTKTELANRDKVLKSMEDLAPKISYTTNSSIESGLVDYAEENDLGLIAVLPKSYTFIERIFHDSLTTRMAFHSPIPLLVLK